MIVPSVQYELTRTTMISYGYVGGAMIDFRSDKAHDLNMSERMLMIAVCSYANNDGFCWPSHKELSRVSGGSVSTVKRLLKSLELKGYISIQQRRDTAGDLTTCLYKINIKKAEPVTDNKVVSMNNHKTRTTEERLFDVSWSDNGVYSQVE